MWSLYENDVYLSPLVFSNGKTQEDVVNEIIESINSGCKIIFIKGVCGTGKCLEKNTRVFCKPYGKENFGYYKISDLVGEEGEIISLNEKGEFIISRFRNVLNSGIKKIYCLKTRTGRAIMTSANHPFLTITSKGIEWKKLEEMNNKSYICLPAKIKLGQNKKLDKNKIKILAYLIAEGGLGDKAGSPRFYQDKVQNKETRSDYEKSLKELFPDGEIKSYSDEEVLIVFRKMDTRLGTTNKLRLFIREYGLDGKKSKDKFVPEIIFNLDEESISLFLRVLFSCDGSIYIKKNRKRKNDQTIIEYCSISKRLVQDISLLLSIIGIHHTITTHKFRENPEYSWRIVISNQEQIKRYIEKIGFGGRKQEIAKDVLKHYKEHKFTNIDKVPRVIREYLKNKGYDYNELDRFLNYEEIEELRKDIGFKQIRKQKLVYSPCVFKQGKIDFLREHLSKVNNYLYDENLSFICNKDIIWDKIKSIEYSKDDETYDLEVPKYHNFIADGIIVHNSAIALNLAKEIGKASIVVPIKNLQKQYEDDYTNKKYLLKNNKKLKIKIITGRANHLCPYLKENTQEFKIEKDSKLTDFDSKSNENDNFEMNLKINKFAEDFSCNNPQLPCKIEIKEKNFEKIKEYLKKNPKIDIADFLNVSIRRVRRMSIAPVCQYWSPIVPSEIEMGLEADCKYYLGLKNRKFTIYQRKKGCEYYGQFDAYLDSDVIIFNSQKYKLETLMDRKPATDIEIVDECDEFLDSFSNNKKINLNRLNFALGNLFAEDNKTNEIINESIELTNKILKDKKTEKAILNEDIIHIKDTKIFDLLKNFLDYELMRFVECDEENYCYYADEVARTFDGFFDETYLSFYKEDKDIIVKVVTTNLEKRFKELLDKNKIIVMMSGTIHSENVLKNIFGLTDFKIIDAETKMPGKITNLKTGLEINCKHENFLNGEVTRKQYLLALEECIELAKKPILVHINSFKDLPTEQEVKQYNLKIMSQEKLKYLQTKESVGEQVKKFKNHEIEILYSTKCNRGVDFPGSSCNSIVLTKYPYPDVQDLFWRILKKTKPQHYTSFYMDKAKRELLQRIYRGLRSNDDHIFLLSPDIRVLNRHF